MNKELQAVKAALQALHPVYIGWATGTSTITTPAVPYYVLSGPSWASPEEAPLVAEDAALDAPLRVTAVGGNAEAAGILLENAKDLLSPNGAETALPVDGKTASIRWIRGEFVGVDRDVTVTNTNRHPGVGVDTYRLVSEPA